MPYWEYGVNSQFIRYDLLTHIACFDFVVDSLGNISSPLSWPWTDLINEAHSNGVKVLMTVTNFDSLEIRNLINDQDARQNFFSSSRSIIQQYSLDGIIVDFEGLAVRDRGNGINGLIQELETLKENTNSNKTINIFFYPLGNFC